MAAMNHAVDVCPPLSGKRHPTGLDRALAELAPRQHGVVARQQLIALGISRHPIDYLIARGWVRVVHRGVYAVGHSSLTQKGRWMAAVLAAGPGAVLSHRSAAALWRLGMTELAPVEVTIPRSCRRRSAVVTHRAVLVVDEITIVDGIPVTTVARTLLDLAAFQPRRQLERALHEADIQRLWDVTGLHALVDRYPARRGTRTLRAILADHVTISKHELERRFLAFLEGNGFPRPQSNRLIPTAVRSYECDVVFAGARLIVELDGYETHGTRKRFEEDRARDRALTIGRWRVNRITWRQLRDDPHELARDLHALLDTMTVRAACSEDHAIPSLIG